jgi:hypothetical protein
VLGARCENPRRRDANSPHFDPVRRQWPRPELPKPERKLDTMPIDWQERIDAAIESERATMFEVIAHTIAASRGVDAAAFSTAAGDDTVPPGLLYGTTPITAAALDADAMANDIDALLNAIAVNNIDTTGAIFIADGGTIGILKTAVGPRFDFGLLSTLALPAKTVVCVAPAAVASAYAHPPQIEVSKIPAVHFEATDPLPIAKPGSPLTVAAPLYSHFQADMISVKCRARCAWAVLSGGASFVSGIHW